MSSTTGEADKLSSTSARVCHHFSIAEIQSATNDFDDELVIGKGGFGKVYKGRICIEETSHVVAIKRLDSKSNQGAPEFRTEIEMLSKLRHCHLVSLFGFCDDNKEMILVYEYMPHGTLDDHLHKADTPLNWVQRLKIAIGAGRGLDYLHTGVGTQHGVIHRDVKSSNILLDENWAARISDFGLSKVGPINQSSSYVDASVKGTFGYLDPEYFYTRRLTRKTDVFAFGVVLFELLSGRLAVDVRLGVEQCSLVRWAQKCVKDRKLDQMVDSNIRGTVFPKCLRRFAQTADRCLSSVPKERPSMTEVVASLQVLLELQEKHDDSAESSGVMGFTWKMHKYLVSTTKQNSDQQGGTSSQKSLENHMNQRSSINKDGSDHGEMPHQHRELVAGDLKKFTFDELQCAVDNIDNDRCLGSGRYGEAYKGWVDKTTYSASKVDTGLLIVIRRFRHYKNLDLEMLKEFSHPNLVTLIGCCLRLKEVFLVYEFMPNGNFEDCLDNGTIAELPLVTKVKIAVGIARGIVFLHQTQDEVRKDSYKTRAFRESWFDRQKIFLDENDRRTSGHGHDAIVASADAFAEVCDPNHIKSDQTASMAFTENLLDYDPWSQPCRQESTITGAPLWTETISESRLDRRKILLGEDFTAKLSDYGVAQLVHGKYPSSDWDDDDGVLLYGDHYPGFEPFQLQTNLFGFTVGFAEVVSGRKICNPKQFEYIDYLWCRLGKKPLHLIAELCFECCNEVNSESKMLTILTENQEGHIPAIRNRRDYREHFPAIRNYRRLF